MVAREYRRGKLQCTSGQRTIEWDLLSDLARKMGNAEWLRGILFCESCGMWVRLQMGRVLGLLIKSKDGNIICRCRGQLAEKTFDGSAWRAREVNWLPVYICTWWLLYVRKDIRQAANGRCWRTMKKYAGQRGREQWVEISLLARDGKWVTFSFWCLMPSACVLQY